MVPVFSGVAFLAGLILEWSGLEIPALVLFWIGLLLGASTFTPGAVRKLFKGKLGIGLLMTISAIGAVILGYVEEAAALAFLYSIAEVSRLERHARTIPSVAIRSPGRTTMTWPTVSSFA